MKTRAQRFLEGRSFLVLTGLLYLVLAGLLFYLIGTRSRPEIGIILSKLVPKVLWINFLLILFGVVLCRRDIATAFCDLFKTGRGDPPSSFSTAVPADAGTGAVYMEEAGPEDAREREYAALAAANRETAHQTGRRRSASPLTAILSTPGFRLLMIVIAGILLVTLVAPQIHRIYYDEDIYANMGQNIAYTGQAGMANYGTFEYGEYSVHWLLYNKDPAGWPFLMGLVFQLFGTDETLAFYLNNLLFAGGILIAFFITRMLVSGPPFPALLAALVYALIPHNLIWANTISAENAAAVFGGLVVLCTLAWLRTRETKRLVLLATVLPFACAMRPESALIAFWVFAATAVNLFADGGCSAAAAHASGQTSRAPFRHPLATRRFWAMGSIAFALSLPMVWHFYAMSGESWGAEGAKFATSFFIGNLRVNGFYFFNNHEYPVLFTLLALIGLAAWKRWRGPERPRDMEGPRAYPGMRAAGRLEVPLGNDDSRESSTPRMDFRSVLLMPLWFLLFWGIFLFFYAGSYKYGADVRFALVCFMPLAVMAGLGGGILRGGLAGLFRSYCLHPERQQAGEDEEGTPAGRRTCSERENRLPIAGLLILLLLISWLKFLPLIRTEGQEAWGARYDHLHAREFIAQIPNRSVVLTHIPTMFLLWGQSAIQTFAGINNPTLIRDMMNRYNGHVYFHKNYWCNAANDSNRSLCEGIAQRYDLEPVAVAREQSYEYGLYRMTFKP